ncbi:2-iminoacetate synthase ThiH [Paenibacillus sambharensis]|uniref:2-iminoacetate synthase ThiH n=1 Tax=Paenibacillus sambharensis TaxID=1803190 RepID=A0A2W1LWN0_9BACL|nr:2-iminoacetate synthase ThiH [Paenibacillus sambharensis]PZD96191.1 2-iminoacetate synthase ThiH [Paenibacillus sambharensis]
MSYYEQLTESRQLDLSRAWTAFTIQDVRAVLRKSKLDTMDYAALLSPAAGHILEELAQAAHDLTVQHFGYAMQLFTPLYLADHCVNHCVYCSFSVTNEFQRSKLSAEQAAAEAQAISQTGIRHLLLLTGESPQATPLPYLVDCVKAVKPYCSSIGIEVNPMDTEAYAELTAAGVDSLTIFQEVYDEDVYKSVHLKGPKRMFKYRLDAPERGCRAGMRSVTIGALLGLNSWREEAFHTGMHARYLQQRYPSTDIAIAVPRLRPHLGGFAPRDPVRDRELVQAMAAYRIFLPRCGITLSTRERTAFRNRLIPLGVTKMSAGASTSVGGHTGCNPDQISQFEISDERSAAELCEDLIQRHYQPVMQDWLQLQPPN